MDNVSGIFPLAPVQSGMLYHSLRESTAGTYVVQYTCEYVGDLDPKRLRTAWIGVVAAHPILRTAFVFEGLDDPLQVVRTSVDLEWSELDWSDGAEAARSERLTRYLADDRQRGFDFARAPLMRLMLARLGAKRHRFVWTYHHAIADGWSSVIVLDEVLRRYADPALTLESAGSFGEFATWLRDRPTADSEEFWRDRLAVDLPTRLGFSRPAAGDSTGHGRVQMTLDLAASDRLREFATKHRLTLSTVAHGAWALVLSGCAGSTEVVYGATVAGRPATLPDVERMVGPFINSLPVRVDTASDESITEWLRTLQEELMSLREHELAAPSDIARWNGVQPSALFESLLVFENAPPVGVAPEAVGLRVVQEEYFDQSNYPFALLVHPQESIALHAVFRKDHVDEGAALRILGYVAEILRALPDESAARPADLVPPRGPERASLVGSLASEGAFETPPPDVVTAFYDQAGRVPTRPAVVAANEEWSYATLRSEVDGVRGALQARGVGAGDRVALLAPKGPHFIASAFGTLACGASFVAIDPAYPDARISEMISTSHARVVVSTGVDHARLEALGIGGESLLQPPFGSESITEVHPLIAAPGPAAFPEDRTEAYVIFTSGSSGAPKGVSVSRSNLAHSTGARTAVYGSAAPRFLLLSPIGFDSSVAGLFWPLTRGGAVVLASPGVERDPAQLGSLIKSAGVTMTLCVPSLYRLLLSQATGEDLDGLDTVIVAGEACPAGVVDDHFRRLPDAALVNEYGPTECTVWSTFARLRPGAAGGGVPIGRPIPGAIVRVLDQAGRLAPIEVAGELCIGGPGVALGYLDEEATAPRFVADHLDGANGGRLYRTGDRVRMRADGVLEFLGRLDDQIKIRGYRIEPGEVEAAMEADARISEAVVAARSAGADDHETLVGYYVTNDGSPMRTDELQTSMVQRLPEHMVPSVFHHVEAVPRTPRGKVDRAALPDPTQPPGQRGALPATEIEKELAAFWEGLLGIPVRGDDSFFEIGGDSLLGIRLLGRIRDRWQTDLNMEALFDHPTLSAMAALVEAVQWARDTNPPRGEKGGGGAAQEEIEL